MAVKIYSSISKTVLFGPMGGYKVRRNYQVLSYGVVEPMGVTIYSSFSKNNWIWPHAWKQVHAVHNYQVYFYGVVE